MNRDTLMAALALAPLFGLFALFLALLFFRSRYNKAHPEPGRTPTQRLRGKIITWIMYGLIVAGCAYAGFQEGGYSVAFYVGLGAFVLGEAVGRRNAQRQREGKPDEPIIFF